MFVLDSKPGTLVLGLYLAIVSTILGGPEAVGRRVLRPANAAWPLKAQLSACMSVVTTALAMDLAMAMSIDLAMLVGLVVLYLASAIA